MNKYVFVLFSLCIYVSTENNSSATNKIARTLNIGATLNSGNSEILQISANFSVVKENETTQIKTTAESNFGSSKSKESERQTTINNAKLTFFLRELISERYFAYLDGAVFHDDIALIRYRIVFGPGAGYFVVKDSRKSLCVEVGPSYVGEKDGNDKDEYLTIRMGEKLEYSFNNVSKLWQAIEFLPRSDDFKDYIFNGEIGIESPLTEFINIRLVSQDKYDNTPAEGIKRNDLLMVASVGVKF